MHLFGWRKNLEMKEIGEENPWGEPAIMPSGLKLLGAFHTADGGKFTLCQESELVKKNKTKLNIVALQRLPGVLLGPGVLALLQFAGKCSVKETEVK